MNFSMLEEILGKRAPPQHAVADDLWGKKEITRPIDWQGDWKTSAMVELPRPSSYFQALKLKF